MHVNAIYLNCEPCNSIFTHLIEWKLHNFGFQLNPIWSELILTWIDRFIMFVRVFLCVESGSNGKRQLCIIQDKIYMITCDYTSATIFLKWKILGNITKNSLRLIRSIKQINSYLMRTCSRSMISIRFLLVDFFF